MSPPPYPRIPYLVASERRDRSDTLAPRADRHRLLNEPVLVEEKIDGANVAIWREGGRFEAMGRGGVDAMDRGRQIGRLRAWLAERYVVLSAALAPDHVLYCEWLFRRHEIEYTNAPGLLVVLDLWVRQNGFGPIDQRNAEAAACGLPVPPVLSEGTLGDMATLRRLHGQSRWTDAAAEGLVVRTAKPPRLLGKAIA